MLTSIGFQYLRGTGWPKIKINHYKFNKSILYSKNHTNETVNIFLQGNIIDLLPLNSDHISLYVKWENSPEIRVYARNTIPITIEEMKKDLEPQVRGLKKEIVFEVYHKKDKKTIGYCVINDINYLDCNAYWGLIIGEKEYWGQNIATEATKLRVQYAFGELNLNKLYARM